MCLTINLVEITTQASDIRVKDRLDNVKDNKFILDSKSFWAYISIKKQAVGLYVYFC